MSFADAIKTFAVINRELPQIIPQQIVNKLSDYKTTGKENSRVKEESRKLRSTMYYTKGQLMLFLELKVKCERSLNGMEKKGWMIRSL